MPDWFLDDCLSALSTGELFSLVEQMEGMVILPLYLYDHSGITMNTTGFSCPWDSGQVGWIYADKEMIEREYGKITPEILEKVRQVLESEVKEYDYYLTGQCYGFQLFKEDVEVDSCWGKSVMFKMILRIICRRTVTRQSLNRSNFSMRNRTSTSIWSDCRKKRRD